MRATIPRLDVVGFGTRQTLASYLSMQTVPETTESAAHRRSALSDGPACANVDERMVAVTSRAALRFIMRREDDAEASTHCDGGQRPRPSRSSSAVRRLRATRRS